MAFEDDFGHDPSQPIEHDYILSASGLVSRTISLWTGKIIQYILIVGVISALCVAVSFILLLGLFGLIGTIGADPVSAILSFILDPLSNPPLIAVSVGFAIVAFVLNAIIYGAAIKFTLDEYGKNRGDVGSSFSHSFGRVGNVIVVQLILGSLAAIILTPALSFAARALELIDITDPFNPIILPGAMEMLLYAMVLLIFGGIVLFYIQIRFAPTLAIVIDTDLSAIDSMKRSWGLTSGNFFHVFGGYILLGIVSMILGLIVSTVLVFTALPDSYQLVITSVVTALLFGALNYIFAVVLYRDLSSRTDTSTLEELMI